MKYLTVILVSLILSNTTTCNKKNETIAQKQEKADQVDQKSKFYITTVNGKDVSNEKLYIIFDEQKSIASGYSGCNGFSCKYTIKNDSIVSFGYAKATKVYCEKKQELENNFFKALIESKTKIIQNNTLVLKNSEDQELISGVLSTDQH